MQQRRRWLPAWIPLGLLLGGGILAVCLIGPSTSEVKADPLSPKGTAAFQTTEKLVVSVPVPDRKQDGTLSVELVGPKDDIIQSTEQKVAAGKAEHLRLEFAALKVPVDKVALRCRLGKQEFTVALKDVLVVKAHETSLNASTEFHANSEASLRLGVHAVKSLSETLPLPEATVAVRLLPKEGKAVSLYEGKTGADGQADVRFKLPALVDGTYKLEIVTKSTLGEEKLERDVKIKSAPKVMLVTDKPLYQPGQMIHIRALALSGFDLTPAANSDLLLEVSDGKGNKVFKKTLKTSDYGIASADFQLADEVNQGDYRIQATLGSQQSDKTVTVKPYVLPKFKLDVKADKKFYLPKETITVEFQGDYIFGKPIAGAKVKITASTFDIAFKDFHTFETKTDAQGHVKFDFKLPEYFVGQPLAGGNGLVKLEVKIIDSADHAETVTKTYPVVDQAVRVNFVPEGGRMIPGVENRVFVAAMYPDGSPAAKCDVNVWLGQKADGKPFTTIKTDDTGLAEFTVTPEAKQFRQGEAVETKVEMLGQQNVVQAWLPKNLFDVFAEAMDASGNQAKTHVALSSEPLGENVLLRLDKAVYKGGDTMKVDVLSSVGMKTVYLDVIRAGQTLLTKWVDIKDGKASYQLDLPPSVFGSLEVHAYQVMTTGEIVRDARVVYVQPAGDLKIDIKADKDVYQPGKEGVIKFQVTDKTGKPTAAALGVLIVDEAVYALQDMQPGLEKVFFTLQEELLKPQVQVLKFDTVDNLVREPVLAADKQRIAEVLLTAARPKAPARWDVNPAIMRRLQAEGQIHQIGWSIYSLALNNHVKVVEVDAKTGKLAFKSTVFADLIKLHGWNEQMLTDPVGGKLTLEGLSRMEPSFSAERFAAALTRDRIQHVGSWFMNYALSNKAKFYKDGKWTFPETVLADALKSVGMPEQSWLRDAWGRPLKLIKRDKLIGHGTGQGPWDFHELVSAGPDGKFETADDVAIALPHRWGEYGQSWWMEEGHRLKQQQMAWNHRRNRFGNGDQMLLLAEMDRFDRAGLGGRGIPVPRAAEQGIRKVAEEAKGGQGGDELRKLKTETATTNGPGEAAAGAPVRVREYFPETMLWRPSLITDDRGRAELPLTFADSITTWRLTASASSKGGALGGTSLPLRVFQDFFVDFDLPLTLTRNDEVAVPATVYNYLKVAQTVTLDLQPEPWFELVDGLGLKRAVEMKANEVKSVYFRLRAKKVGHFPLQVTARSDKVGDAIKRVIEVVPEGQKKEQVVTDRLAGNVVQTLTIPADADPEASKVLVKIYPGVFSQVVEGMDGMLRMPGGCFEQTSSSAYPNILAVDYIKRTKQMNPQVLAKAETYLAAGYQRLLTFEHKNGGFDWWGQGGEPLVWLSAYGLNEFSDMSKVMYVDRGVIDRTQAWLLKQRAADGTWSKIGATHSESIERMGDPKLLLTSYVTWSLLESGVKKDELKKSIEFIRDSIKTADNAYILALAANALAAWDAKDDSTHEALVKVLKKLDEKRLDVPEWKAASFPAGQGHSLSYARGDALTVETTALAVLAMLKHGNFTDSVNKGLLYLVKSKGAHGTWGSTQATILALKALTISAGGTPFKGEAPFTILVNGKEAAKGVVNEQNAELLQQFDVKEFMNPTGENKIAIEVKGETNLMYQIVSRHFEPWTAKPQEKPQFDVAVSYDRTKLSTADMLTATATLKYNGTVPTSMVMLDLGIAPGFTVDAGEFAEMVAAKKVNKFSVTSRQVILYLGDVKPGQELKFVYTLKPKYPIKAKTPSSVAYEYYTPANRGEAKPVELVVEEKK